MKRINSLKGKKVFEEIYKRGKRVRQSGVQLIVLKQCRKEEIFDKSKRELPAVSPEIKVGIPVNRKYGNSVSRNKAKRRIRAICGEILQEVEESYFIIIRPKEEFKNLSYANSKQIIRLLFENAGILRS